MRLTKFLVKNSFVRGVDKTLFGKSGQDQMMIAQIYVDAIVFTGIPQIVVGNFVHQM